MIEPLELRIAPAATFVSPTSATYTDVDGDKVTVVFSKAILNSGNVGNVLVTSAQGLGDQLQTLDLTAALAGNPDGTNITVTAIPQDLTPLDAVKAKSGDGLANVGYLKATGHPLGIVKIGGDLGVIDAGIATKAAAVQSLTVQSMGEFGTTTGAPADLRSDLLGSVKYVLIKSGMRDSFIDVTGEVQGVKSSVGSFTVGGSIINKTSGPFAGLNAAGDIGPVKIGGSVIGGPTLGNAQVVSLNGSIASLSIGGDLIAGTSSFSAYITAAKNIGAVTIGGSIVGGPHDSALIRAGEKMGAVKIGGDLVGGAANSGSIQTLTGDLASVSVRGSVRGGSGTYGGSILASLSAGTAGKMGSVTIGGDLIGGSGADTGRISAAAGIGAVTLTGDLRGGTVDDSGLIASGGKMGAVKVGGEVVGRGGARTGLISAVGDIDSVTLAHSLTGGTLADSGVVSSSAGSLGPVKIGGNVVGGAGSGSGRIFAAKNIGAVSIAGSLLGGGGDDSGQIGLAKFTSGVVHKIGGITIGGDVVGNGGQFSGSLRVVDTFIDEFDSFGAVKVAGDWKGGGGYHSGSIHGATLTSLTLGGSLIGGSNTFAGAFQMTTPTITIGGDVTGGDGGNSGFINNHSVRTLTIGGSLIAGAGGDSGVLNGSVNKVTIGHDLRGPVELSSFTSLTIGGSILPGGRIYGTLGAITVKGSIVGTAAQNVEIIGRGDISLLPGLKPFVALQSLTVGGRVEHALIAVGYQSGVWVDPDAQIGAVKVGGDWIASSLLAGVTPRNGRIGDGYDLKADAGMRDHPELHSKIASIVIGGQVIGEAGDLSKSFGFGAEEIGSFKVNGVALPLKPGRNNDISTDTGAAGAMIPVGSSRANPGTVSDGFAVHVFEI